MKISEFLSNFVRIFRAAQAVSRENGDMRRIDRETVQRIVDTADIVEVVSDFVNLRRSGSGYVGMCPFHNERTPSFHVSKSKGICKCFSCGKGGSPVNFIMEHEQLNYWDALRYLANKYHIDIQEYEVSDAERQAMNERQAMMEINDFAMKHFERNLVDTADGRNVGLAYFRERGINDWAIKRFHLGYSLDRRDDLMRAAIDSGYNEKYLVETGLCGRSDRGSLYDRFKARVMYPVFTISGKAVAFGGRTLSSSKEIAKYINSPESQIYSKSRELYGLYQAKQSIVKKGKCILVEGYMDVISMHQQGIENVVASSGTSLTQGQIRLIHRFTENVTVIYDSDPAGIKASLRGIDLLLAEGLNIKVLLLPEGEDPDSFAQSHTASEVEAYLAAHEVDFIRFKIDMLLKDCEKDPVKRSNVVASILMSIANIPDEITRSIYIKECGLTFGIEEKVLMRQIGVFIAQIRENAARASARQSAVDSITAARDGAEEGQQEALNDGAGGDGVVGNAELVAAVFAGENPHAKMLEPQERALLKLIVKFGMLPLGEDFGSDENGVPIRVIDYVREDLDFDKMAFTNPVYQRIYEEVLMMRDTAWPHDCRVELERITLMRDNMLSEGQAEISRSAKTTEEIDVAEKKLKEQVEEACREAVEAFTREYFEKYLLSHADDGIRTAATELAVEKHQLSKIYFKTTTVESDADRLEKLVPGALLALKYTHVCCRKDDVHKQIVALQSSEDGYDIDVVMSLLKEEKKCLELKTSFASQLGDRVYEPFRKS